MTVKKSLQEVSRSINGDARTDPQPLFKVSVVLDHNRVEFRPTMIKLTQTVNLVSKDLITTIACIPCLADVLVKAQKARAAAAALASEEEGANGRRTVAKGAAAAAPAADEDGKAAAEEGGEGEGGDGGKAAEEGALVVDAGPAEPEKETFYDRISNDEDILKILVQIMNGMSASATELQKYLSQWDKYKPLWEMDKDAFIRRYAKASRPLSQYDIDITRYKDQQSDIVEEDLNMTINFIKIESSLLKATLTDHCVQWQNKLLKLLNDNALQELKSIQGMFKENTETLESHSQTLEELGNKINLHKGCNAAQGETEARFEPVEEMYKVLARFEVPPTEEEQLLKESLRPNWALYQEMLVTADATLKNGKQTMRRDLENSVDQFQASVQETRKEALQKLPYSADFPTAKAFDKMEEFQDKLAAMQEREEALKPGLAIFDIEAPQHVEQKELERDLAMLGKAWSSTKDWDGNWKQWKDGKFGDLDVDNMELTAAQYVKSLTKLGREIKSFNRGGNWKVVEALDEKVKQFRQTMPLIQNLKNPAIRERHWDQLHKEINKDFDPHGDDFTLEKVFTLGLHLHSEFVGTMSSNANKELAIETALGEIEEAWRGIDIELAPFKEVYYKIKTTEDLFTQLEDNQVALSTMKASRFYLSFEEKITKWEAALSTISEVVEMIMTVMRQWMYLESIFMSSEDIRHQLPRETVLFDQVNTSYKETMERMVQVTFRFVLSRGCHFVATICCFMCLSFFVCLAEPFFVLE